MQQIIELWYAIEFRVGLEKSGLETLDMIRRAFKDKNVSQTTVYKYHKLFKDYRESMEYMLIAERPSSSRTDDILQRVHEVLLNSDHRLSASMVGDEIGIDEKTINSGITKNLTIRKIYIKFVPNVLTNGQKQMQVSACQKHRPHDDKLQRNDFSYIPYLALVDYFLLFPKVKSSLKRHHHKTVSAVGDLAYLTLRMFRLPGKSLCCWNAAGKSMSTFKGCNLKNFEVL